MITTKIKRMTLVTTVEINRLEPCKSFQIRLPANVTRITGVMVTASKKERPVD